MKWSKYTEHTYLIIVPLCHTNYHLKILATKQQALEWYTVSTFVNNPITF